MRYTILARVFCASASLAIIAATAGTLRATIVRFDTSAGSVDVRLYDEETPMSVENFLNYVESDRYDETFIHRNAIKGGPDGPFEPFVIQGGGFQLNGTIFDAEQIEVDDPVTNEPGITNIRGSLAYAKVGSDPDSATSQWFFNLSDNSFLDTEANNAFTVFGRVIRGTMDVVDDIAALPIISAVDATGVSAFGEIPVFDATKVLDQSDILEEDAVMINSVDVLDFPDGDYNFDGTVNSSDYIVWRNTNGSTTMAEADGNGDGEVNDADLEIWRDNFGASTETEETGSGSTSQGVPEPATLILLLLGTASALCQRIRGRRPPSVLPVCASRL